MSKLSFFLIGLAAIIFAIGIYNEAFAYVEEYAPDEALWLDGRIVMIFYLDIIPCGDEKFTLGCFEPFTDTIYILKGYQFHWATVGCNVRDHEIFHALGYDHVSMQKFNCPNPNEQNWEALQYNLENPKHKDLTIDYYSPVLAQPSWRVR